jgi:hypothetical protein
MYISTFLQSLVARLARLKKSCVKTLYKAQRPYPGIFVLIEALIHDVCIGTQADQQRRAAQKW